MFFMFILIWGKIPILTHIYLVDGNHQLPLGVSFHQTGCFQLGNVTTLAPDTTVEPFTKPHCSTHGLWSIVPWAVKSWNMVMDKILHHQGWWLILLFIRSLTIPGGAGFCPSTVWWWWWNGECSFSFRAVGTSISSLTFWFKNGFFKGRGARNPCMAYPRFLAMVLFIVLLDDVNDLSNIFLSTGMVVGQYL